MLNHLEAPARLVIRTCLGLFTAAVIVLLQSSFWTNAVSGWMRAIIIAAAVLAYFRPHLAVLLLAVLVPLGQVGSRTLDANMRGAEALVLAFLTGALLRGWVLHRFRSVPSDTLQIVSFVFALVVAASCVEQLWFAQLQRNFPAAFLQDVLRYAGRRYIVGFDGLDMIFSAMLLLEGMALMLYAAHYCRVRVGFASRLLAMLMTGAALAAVVNLTFIGAALSSLPKFDGGTIKASLLQRWTVHVGDVNAAASYFGMALFIALGVVWRSSERRSRWWIVGAFLVGTAFWLTGLRTAMVSALIVTIVLTAKLTIARSARVWTIAALVAGGGIVFGLLFPKFFPYSFVDMTASDAVEVRWLFLQTTWNMLRQQPLFGVGIGQYALWSTHFAPPEMMNHYVRENAHNYFAQIAGELGVVGLATFLAVLVSALWVGARSPDRPSHPLQAPLTAGLAAFVLTWLGGHPLLVPEVSYPFWLALGIIPSLLMVPAGTLRYGPFLSALLCIGLAVSIVPRVKNKSAGIDFTRVTYGMSSGTINANGRFFVASGASHLRIPLRARDATPEAPIIMDILVDDRPAGTVTFGDSGWRDAQVDLPRPSHGGSRKIDLRTREREQRSRVDIGKWEIISVPHA